LNFKGQDFESKTMRQQLKSLATNLNKVVTVLKPESQDQLNQKKKDVYNKILQSLNEEHQRLLARRTFIEKIKEQKRTRDAAKGPA